MAPPKTATLVSNNNNNIANNNTKHQQQVKPRKRKGPQQQQQAPKQSLGNKEPIATQKQAQKPAQQAEQANENKQQVPSIVSEPKQVIVEKKNKIVAKQISNEETDDVDAGIELDGSSNSGSSVKDMGEDQLKSASASPVMAPSAPAAEPEKPLSPASVPASASSKKTTSKQQLAAKQEVIDADEQLLQQKLQKEKRQQLETAAAAGDRKAGQPKLPETVKSTAPPFKRRFSSQSSTESQSSEGQSVCKVCSQHVYQMERMLAEKSVYHKRCFRCFQCKIQLRVDSYSSHEGQVYCKTHHRQLFQPQVKLDSEEDVDIVAKSRARQRQMIICENEPKELPKDVVRSDTKLDDGIDQLNLNLGNILQKFERGQASNVGGDSENTEGNSSPSAVQIEKPSINIKQTLKAFESRLSESGEPSESSPVSERPVVRKLTNINEKFLKRDSESQPAAGRALPMRRSESLMMRLKKYESRIAGEEVDKDDDEDEQESDESESAAADKLQPKKLVSVNLSSLKSQWENGDINNNKSDDGDDDDEEANDSGAADCQKSARRKRQPARGAVSAAALEIAALRRQHQNSAEAREEDEEVNKSPVLEKEEELCRIRQQLARKKVGGSSIRNIYENAIKEAQEQTNQSISKSRRDSSDLSALNGTIRTNEIQQQLLKQVKTSYNSNDNTIDSNNITRTDEQQQPRTPTTPKEHFQLNLSNRANKLKERFELGLINNSSRDDSDGDSEEGEQMSKLEQIRQEKLEDLSIFTEGEIKAREARSLFQQIDRRISAANATGSGGGKPVASSRSLASIGASMRAKLTNQINGVGGATSQSVDEKNGNVASEQNKQPIRLTNNVVKT